MSTQVDNSIQGKEQATAERLKEKETAGRQKLEQLCINTIRTLAMDAVQKANSRPSRYSHGAGAAGFCPVGPLSAAQSRTTRTGQAATASFFPTATPRCCCMPCCT